MLQDLGRKFDRDWGWNLARILAYACIQMLFAVAGLILVIFALVLQLTNETTLQLTARQIERVLPDRITSNAILSFERSLQHAPAIVLLFALPVILWEGTRFFVVLESALCVIFRREQRRFVAQNRVALAMLLLFTVALPIIVASAAVVPQVGIATETLRANAEKIHPLGNNPLISSLGLGAGLAANFALFLLVYMWVTPGGNSLRACWPGALVSALLSQLYLLLFPLYVHDVLHPDHFGSIAGFALVVLVFFFAYSCFIIVGAEIASYREGYRAAPQDIPTTLMRADPPLVVIEPPAPPPTTSAAWRRVLGQVSSTSRPHAITRFPTSGDRRARRREERVSQESESHTGVR
jgi:uncharacterized BrkB/YihY/UPF0761 family membrane protein